MVSWISRARRSRSEISPAVRSRWASAVRVRRSSSIRSWRRSVSANRTRNPSPSRAAITAPSSGPSTVAPEADPEARPMPMSVAVIATTPATAHGRGSSVKARRNRPSDTYAASAPTRSRASHNTASTVSQSTRAAPVGRRTTPVTCTMRKAATSRAIATAWGCESTAARTSTTMPSVATSACSPMRNCHIRRRGTARGSTPGSAAVTPCAPSSPCGAGRPRRATPRPEISRRMAHHHGHPTSAPTRTCPGTVASGRKSTWGDVRRDRRRVAAHMRADRKRAPPVRRGWRSPPPAGSPARRRRRAHRDAELAKPIAGSRPFRVCSVRSPARLRGPGPVARRFPTPPPDHRPVPRRSRRSPTHEPPAPRRRAQ